ncbi:methyltransferase domain-containing protein [Nocardioides sp. AX2bis]|uniref:methyltransferase domain-containing protein n=1 Tax=Nocardioides sp. AX2bis TaxID=2653157 RepID=UPI0012F1FB93|nr:methyltransferase domain-containing protein [Nocardioides sp. AX2bis]VXB61029.1 Methyltransferase family protein [Nocardioides sp. AX2bis]
MTDDEWPPGFFDRQDSADDAEFYVPPRLVTHLDDAAIAAVSALYNELGVPDGRVLDLMSSWVSHLSGEPAGGLVVLGMNDVELRANPMAEQVVVQDLNVDPRLPFEEASFDAVTCCVSVDYLTRPVAVLREVRRVLRPGGVVVLTFSNRCFPTKAVRGWLSTDDDGRVAIVRAYLEQAGFDGVRTALRTPPRGGGDPLYGAWARIGS